MHKTILGIDPGTRYMGYAAIRGKNLLDFGVHTLRNGAHPHDVIGQARTKVLALIRQHGVQVVAIEEPLMLPTKRAARLSVIVEEMTARSADLGLTVREISPQEVRRVMTGNPRANKFEVAQSLVAGGFEQLRPLVPPKPPHPTLGWNPKDKYWLHMFDGLALAVASQGRGGSQPTRPPS